MKKTLLFTLLLIATFGFSQDGNHDLTFNPPVHTDNAISNGFAGEVHSIKILSSGRILAFGEMTHYMGQPCQQLVMLNPNGSIYTGFNVGSGPSDGYFGYPAPYCMDEQPDGKIVIGGNFTSFNGVNAYGIVRLNPDGSLDNSFAVGNGANGTVTGLKVLADGKIMVGGTFTSFGSAARKSLVRLNANGSVDNTFAVDTGFGFVLSGGGTIESPYVSSIAEQDGKYLIAGKFNRYKSVVCSRNVIRLNQDGSVDTTFQIGTGGPENGRVNQLVYDQTNDKIYMAGWLTPFNGNAVQRVVKLNGDGTPDTAFNANVPALGDSFSPVNSIALLADGSLLMAGQFEIAPYRNNMKKLFADGSDDTSFQFNSQHYQVDAVVVAADGGIYVAGLFDSCGSVSDVSNQKGNIAKILPNGQTDLSFNPNWGTALFSRGLFVHDDGTILLNAGVYNERECSIAQIDATGNIVRPNFFETPDGSKPTFSRFLKSADGNLLCLGILSCYKMDPQGTVDPNFYNVRNAFAASVVNCNFNDFVELPDGKLLVGGNFKLEPIGNTIMPRQRVLRLNADGTLDTTYNIGAGFDSNSDNYSIYQQINTLALQPDQKLIAAGSVDRLLGQPIGRIARLNPDGTPDITFLTGSGFDNDVYKVLLLADGKILVSGAFTHYNGSPCKFIARLNPDGTLDNTFASPYTFTSNYSRVEQIVMQTDGKTIVTAFDPFTLYLNRLNPDGSIDPTFNNTHVFTMDDLNDVKNMSSLALLNDNRILLKGNFTKIDGTVRSHIALFGNSGNLSTDAPADPESASSLSVANPVHSRLEIWSASEIQSIRIFDLSGRNLLTTQDKTPDVSHLPAGIYIVQVTSQSGNRSVKIIKE